MGSQVGTKHLQLHLHSRCDQGDPLTPNPRHELAWRKSSYSSGGGNCVKVASYGPDAVALRDSKDPDRPRCASPARHSPPSCAC
ncbi:DUF397 domain-containing protein [Streptomyces platensis]|uniref:DUF397 domain-containing protein n=1 Tax=Streptomyces platensis TaxID=58346 RepID=UPI0034D6243C|nr:DUF397 domain-containing protein [Streptomyces platensis]